MRALAKDPRDRFSGCSEFAEQIRASQSKSGPSQSRSESVRQPESPRTPDAFLPPQKPIATAPVVATSAGMFALGAAIAAIAYSTNVAAEQQFAKNLLAFVLLAGVVAQLRLLYRGWKVIQDGRGGLTPAGAVAGTIVPILNLFWVFRAYGGFPNEYNRFLERHGVDAPRLEGPWFAIFSVCFAAANVLVFVAGARPNSLVNEITGIVWLAWIALAFIVNVVMCGAINRLAEYVERNAERGHEPQV